MRQFCHIGQSKKPFLRFPPSHLFSSFPSMIAPTQLIGLFLMLVCMPSCWFCSAYDKLWKWD
ncbi:hypothetical protein BDZ91DRAFT_738799 [Kalaharituber pfeilii]|nr:hypothetical protein BDZ91DRAFT_738799 [Kalaharituber pfeilii]